MSIEAVRVGFVLDEVRAGRVRPDRDSIAGYVGALLDGCPLPRDRYAYSVACWNDFNRGKTA